VMITDTLLDMALIVGRNASSCQRNPPRNWAQPDTVNCGQPAPHGGRAGIPAGWPSAT